MLPIFKVFIQVLYFWTILWFFLWRKKIGVRKELAVIYELMEIVFAVFQRCIKENLSPFFHLLPRT